MHNASEEQKEQLTKGMRVESLEQTVNLPNVRARIFGAILKDVYYNPEEHETEDIEDYIILNSFLNSLG